MRRFLAIAALASLSALSVASAQTTAPSLTPSSSGPWTSWKKVPVPPLPAFHPQQPTKITLQNGMTVFLQEDHELPFINGFVIIRGGSSDEPAAKTGLIDLYSQAWRTSGTAKMTGDQMDDVLEAKAAKIETDGDAESTTLTWTSFKQDFDQVFGMATDLLLHPQFRADKLMLAKQQEATGIIRRNDDPNQIAMREAQILAYGKDNPYARIPEFATVQAVTLSDLTAWHARTVTPNNIIIGVSGDFNTAEMEAKLRAAFDELPRGPKFVATPVAFPGPTPGVYLAQKSDVNQSNVWIVGMGTEKNNPDYYALSVMNTVFSGGFGSRLFQDVRTQAWTGLLRVRRLWRGLRPSRNVFRRRRNEERQHRRGDECDDGADSRFKNRSADADRTQECEGSAAEFLGVPFRFAGENSAPAGDAGIFRISGGLY